MRRRHKIIGIAHNWQVQRTECIEAGLPSSSMEESLEDDDRTMKEASDNKPEPMLTPAPIVGFTTAQAYFNVVMAEEAQ